MEEKKPKIYNRIWPISRDWNIRQFFSVPGYYSSVKGFTLVEVLIVVGVIGILATSLIVLIDPISQSQKSRDSKRKADLKQIQSALELYRSDHGEYPPDGAIVSGSNLIEDGTEYLKVIPVDPKNEGQYRYTYDNTGNGYEIYVCAENEDTPETEASGSCDSGQRIFYTNP